MHGFGDLVSCSRVSGRMRLIQLCSAGAAALIRIPTTKALLTSADFFVDCVPIAVGFVFAF